MWEVLVNKISVVIFYIIGVKLLYIHFCDFVILIADVPDLGMRMELYTYFNIYDKMCII